MIRDLVEAAVSFGWIQWLAFFFNILYVVLAVRENRWCWVFGFVGVALLLVLYFEARLYSDVLLQLFYLVMSVYGWISWSEKSEGNGVPIVTKGPVSHLYYLITGIIGTFLLGFIFSHLQAAVPYIDAFTSAFAVIATFLVARKILENWIYWIVIDTVCVVVYVIRDLPLIALLFAIYTILAVVGFIQWSRKFRHQNQKLSIQD